jgi:hypothetical protein
MTRLFGQEPPIVLIEALALGQPLFPLPFQFAGYQTVLWVHDIVLSPRPRRLVVSPFQTLLPVGINALAILLHPFGSAQA